jgi:hypothetical protein
MLSEMVESTPGASYRFRRKWNPDNAKSGGTVSTIKGRKKGDCSIIGVDS